MAQPPHFGIDGAIYFVTTRLKEEGCLLTGHQAQIVQRTILDLANGGELILYAYVIMPNRIHILLKPINNGISKTM